MPPFSDRADRPALLGPVRRHDRPRGFARVLARAAGGEARRVAREAGGVARRDRRPGPGLLRR